MAPDVIQMIKERLDRSEDQINSRFDRIEANLATLTVHLRDHPPCPKPGACVYLELQMTNAKQTLTDHTLEIQKLKIWQAGMVAIFGFLGLVVSPVLVIFGPLIRKYLNLP